FKDLSSVLYTQNAYLTKVDIKDTYLTVPIYMDSHSYLSIQLGDQAQANLATILNHLQTLGFPINWKKSVLTPAQVMEFLGMTINTQ
ncbi:hypothetical protein H4R33_006193, partial [Dimargaris cristalligena]